MDKQEGCSDASFARMDLLTCWRWRRDILVRQRRKKSEACPPLRYHFQRIPAALDMLPIGTSAPGYYQAQNDMAAHATSVLKFPAWAL